MKNQQKVETVNLQELAKNLRAHRASLTQAAVSSAAGKNTATYTYWESGTTEPGALALSRACLFMGCTPNDVLLKGAAQSLGDDLPPHLYQQLIETLKELIRLHHASDESQPSPISTFNTFVKNFSRSMAPSAPKTVATKPAKGRAKASKVGGAERSPHLAADTGAR